MSHVSHVDTVRQQIRTQFEELGFRLTEPPAETILIRAGHFCGRRFHQGEAYAVWLIEENRIIFYDNQGTELLVLTSPVAERGTPRQAARA